MSPVSVSGDRRRLWRSRWAAIGAAVAVTLGGGGIFAVQAASSAPSSVVTIDPVRILDTRDPVNVGLPGPFVSAVPQKLQVTGTAVPTGATGVLLNVTVVAPSANGFLAVRPGDATGEAATSSLNFNAGETVPNSVQVGLPTTGTNAGKIDITYNAYGVAGPTAEVLIDVVGYMIPPSTGSLGFVVAPPTAVSSLTTQGVAVTVQSISVNAPVGGKVLVTSTTQLRLGSDVFIVCAVSNGAPVTADYTFVSNSGASEEYSSFARTIGFDVPAGTATFQLTCVRQSVTGSGIADLYKSNMTAVFQPN